MTIRSVARGRSIRLRLRSLRSKASVQRSIDYTLLVVASNCGLVTRECRSKAERNAPEGSVSLLGAFHRSVMLSSVALSTGWRSVVLHSIMLPRI